MSLDPDLLPHTIVLVRPASSTDAHNNVVLDYDVGTATRTTITNVRLIQRTAAEQYAEGRDPDVETWDMLTNEADIVSTDRIEWASHPARGAVTFEIQGPPMPRYDGGSFHHTKAPLRIHEG